MLQKICELYFYIDNHCQVKQLFVQYSNLFDLYFNYDTDDSA